MIFDFFKEIDYAGESIVDINRDYRSYIDKVARNYQLEEYVVVGDPTTEILAYRLYGDTTLFWLLIYLNDITDPWHGWVKSQEAVYESAQQKYKKRGGVDQVVFHMNSDFEVFYDLVEHPTVPQTWYHKGDKTFSYIQYNGFLQPVDVYTAEEMINDKKRKIKIVNPNDIVRFMSDLNSEIDKIKRSEENK